MSPVFMNMPTGGLLADGANDVFGLGVDIFE